MCDTVQAILEVHDWRLILETQEFRGLRILHCCFIAEI